MAGGDSFVAFVLPALIQSTRQTLTLSLFFCVFSGRSARAQSLDFLEGRGFTAETPPSVFDALNVTVPGAPACWCDTVQLFGSHKVCLCVFVLSVCVDLYVFYATA